MLSVLGLYSTASFSGEKLLGVNQQPYKVTILFYSFILKQGKSCRIRTFQIKFAISFFPPVLAVKLFIF